MFLQIGEIAEQIPEISLSINANTWIKYSKEISSSKEWR